jgi:hypothetical protein
MSTSTSIISVLLLVAYAWSTAHYVHDTTHARTKLPQALAAKNVTPRHVIRLRRLTDNYRLPKSLKLHLARHVVHQLAFLTKCFWTVLVIGISLLTLCHEFASSNLGQGFATRLRLFLSSPTFLSLVNSTTCSNMVYILPFALLSCTTRGFWNQRRFVRVVLCQAACGWLPSNLVLVLNALVFVATVAFDYESDGM